MPLERDGGQAQFIVPERPPAPRGSTMEPLLRWLDQSAGRDLTTADIAARAGMSTRTLNRHFREQTGTTPLQWLHRARIRQAQHLLETTGEGVDLPDLVRVADAAMYRSKSEAAEVRPSRGTADSPRGTR